MAGSALSILNAIKEQVKECEACFQDAAALNEMIKGFEVVLMVSVDALFYRTCCSVASCLLYQLLRYYRCQ
jgi:hypothetical protein